MDSAQPPDLSGTAPATSKVLEGSGHGFAGPENGLTRKEGFPHKALSWAGIAQEKKVLRKYTLDVTNSEGQLNVEIPDEVVINVNPLWEDFIIGNFLDTAPHIARIHAVVNKIWRDGGKGQAVEVFVVDSTTIKFRVGDIAMRNRILRRGMWNIGNIPMVVAKWTPKELEEKPEVKSIPLWVHLKNVPMNMFSWEGLSFITSAAGHPVKLHPETAACSNFKLAKIFINADLSKELPSKINFTKNGKSSPVEFIYPWLPVRCHTCNKWGHTDKVCVMNKKEESPRTVTEIIQAGYLAMKTAEANNTIEMNNNKEEPQKKVVAGEEAEEAIVEGKETVEEGEAEVDSREVDAVGKNAEEIEEPEEGEVVGATEVWAHVSPGKTSRSPKSLESAQVTLASRFSALESADENGNLVVNIGELVVSNEESALEECEEEVSKEICDMGRRPEETQEGKEPDKQLEMEQSRRNGSKTGKEENQGSVSGERSLRPSLPRSSKTNHKILHEHSNKETDPGTQGKRSRKSSQ
ncbi:uncharacterized protein LOC111205492 [Brassica napus]|uniref:uncharacterized protein LOC111205492 n=1 Tax=Brassica napus TaxID=3708 RepID=UPI00207943E7|nr:uncharacterized protein LOC111205492 [Brassica napus]XP_048610952.1 uncharacterized protein LOC111205492 [Brassica napus]